MTAARRDSGARVLGAMVLGAMALTATTAAAQGLDQRIRAAATAAVTWVGYRVPMVAGPRQMCCYDNVTNGTVMSGGSCRLESGSGVSMNTGDSIRVSTETGEYLSRA